mmetsp:Transcript_55996/g.132870  ORF Transcript_55996/g.132870 Transcript_55996/m.132870 type:complete len:249 (-) Transcript_55996:403-1149(-)
MELGTLPPRGGHCGMVGAVVSGVRAGLLGLALARGAHADDEPPILRARRVQDEPRMPRLVRLLRVHGPAVRPALVELEAPQTPQALRHPRRPPLVEGHLLVVLVVRVGLCRARTQHQRRVPPPVPLRRGARLHPPRVPHARAGPARSRNRQGGEGGRARAPPDRPPLVRAVARRLQHRDPPGRLPAHRVLLLCRPFALPPAPDPPLQRHVPPAQHHAHLQRLLRDGLPARPPRRDPRRGGARGPPPLP